MYVPAARERVHVEGRSQSYFVLAVDRPSGVATLVDLRGPGYVDEVPFAKLMPCKCGAGPS
jgi:hypothetical protein